jgi:hypothetical protein
MSATLGVSSGLYLVYFLHSICAGYPEVGESHSAAAATLYTPAVMLNVLV